MPEAPDTFPDLPILDEIGRELDASFARAGERRAPRRGLLRPTRTARSLALAVLLLALLAATAAAATLLVLRGSVIPSPSERDVPPTMRPLAGSQRLLALRAPDPRRGPGWGMRVGRSQTGLVCSTVGQVVGGRIGVVGLDGRFRELPEGVLDSCGREHRDAAALLGARVFDAPRRADVRTVVNGVAGRDLRTVSLLTARGRRSVPVGAGGAFLTVVAGYPEDLALRVELGFADRRRRVYNLGADRFVDPDPARGPAWKLSGGIVDTYDGLCVGFRLARPGRGGGPSSPPACGHSKGPRNGTQRDPWFFAIRRVRPGDHGRVGIMAWRWGRFAPRTAAWGSVRRDRVRRVIVHGPGGARSMAPSVNGSFLVVYGPKVRAGQVSVELVLRDGRHLRFHRSAGLITPRKWHP